MAFDVLVAPLYEFFICVDPEILDLTKLHEHTCRKTTEAASHVDKMAGFGKSKSCRQSRCLDNC